MKTYTVFSLLALLIFWQPVQAQFEDEFASDDQQRLLFDGEVTLRGDYVDFHNNREDLERGQLIGLFGLSWLPSDLLEFRLGARLAAGTDSNGDNVMNLDNERTDDVALDELSVLLAFGEHTDFELGKTRLPLSLSGLLWDPDLRPVGGALRYRQDTDGFDQLSLMAGHFAGDHINEDESRITAAQLGWLWNLGAPAGGALLVSFVEFSDLEELVADGRARTNRVVNGQLVSDYELIDARLDTRWSLGQLPLRTSLEAVHNLGADDNEDGGRVSLIFGGDRQYDWEFGVTYQRLQADAAMAAFNDDDWWFPTAMRGTLAWIGFAREGRFDARLAGFRERRDNTDNYLKRVLLDLRWHF